MKTIGRGIVLAIVLAAAPMAFVSAQNPQPSPVAQDVVTHQELKDAIKSQDAKTVHAIRRTERRANERMDVLSTTEQRDADAAITTMVTQGNEINKNTRTSRGLESHLRNLGARTTVWLICLSGVIVIAIIVGAIFVWWILRNQRASNITISDPEMSHLQERYQEYSEKCRATNKKPQDPYVIHFGISIRPDPDNGKFLKGNVRGFRAEFREGDAYPAIYFGGRHIQWDQRARYAARALQHEAEGTSKA